jgi:3D (Asp-Asp-Asp) domain-containing protein
MTRLFQHSGSFGSVARSARVACLVVLSFGLLSAGAGKFSEKSPVLNAESREMAGLASTAELLHDSVTDHASGTLLPADLPAVETVPTFRVIEMEVTAYCPCARCCGPSAAGITASGKRVDYNRGRFVAADTRVLPFGSRLQIPGYHAGETVEVIDRGGAIKGNKLDVFFPSHDEALQWGRRRIPVTVLQ